MDSLHTGCDELIYIQTEKVSLTIKGAAPRPGFRGMPGQEETSAIRISCPDEYQLSLAGRAAPGTKTVSGGVWSGIHAVSPLFFEQQGYELIIEAEGGHKAGFWHDNLNLRNKVTRAGRRHEILSGVINFGSEIGLSDLVVQVDGAEYLRLVIEIYPSKIRYKEDYQAIVEDVTREVYNVVFDFLKKTYLGYRQGDEVESSPVEFFTVIQKIYGDFIKAADMILMRPHHMLETTHEVLPGHKVRRTDVRTLRWIERHPAQAAAANGRISAAKALAVKRRVTYDTKENRLTKYILQSTAKKLRDFKRGYMRLRRQEDQTVILRIDEMIKGLERRGSASFLKDAGAHEVSCGMSLVFSMAAGYRDLYKHYLTLLRGLSISGDIFNISVKDLALLYEYWCFIKLNSMMKDRFALVSQDIVKVRGGGLFVSLVRGQGSRVKYRDPDSGEIITLSYNPKAAGVPTVSQCPDIVLTLEKKGANVQYEYVFDAKYRINPALPGSDYYQSISHTPGPEISDINTMHRYRDAIVCQNGTSSFERTTFGAYVLFPYNNEEEYRHHRFYKSIGKVNVGGLPFLPSAMELVSNMLEELISDSPESAFERATLPRGIEERPAKIDWSVRDVLVGALRDRRQLDACLDGRFYHIPQKLLRESGLPVRYVAIYQSKSQRFGSEAGIQYYGEVTRCIPVKRAEITEIPKESDEPYYRFEVKEWKKLAEAIAPKEMGFTCMFTNLFLLEHSAEVPELLIRTEQEYRLYSELKRALKHFEINSGGPERGFKFNDSFIVFEEGEIRVYRGGELRAKYGIQEFSGSPNAVFRRIKKAIVCNMA